MSEGWISLHRKFVDWEWYDDNNVVKLFVHCLLKANHKEKKWKGITIPKGSFITGRKKLSIETRLSEQQIRTSLNKLISTNEITIKSTNLNSLISITNWDLYQDSNQQTTKLVTKKQPTSNQQVTTTNNENNENNEDKYSDEIKNFTNSITKYFPDNSIPKNMDNWYDVTDKLTRIEKYPLIDIEIIIKEFRDNEFWKDNFQSYKKLRAKNKDGIKYIDYFANILKNNYGANKKSSGASNTTPEGLREIVEQFPD